MFHFGTLLDHGYTNQTNPIHPVSVRQYLLRRRFYHSNTKGGDEVKLHDLVKPIDKQTEEELLERLRQIRHNRFVERPAAKKKAAKEAAEPKARRSKAPKGVDELLSGMSDAEREALIEKLTQQAGGGNVSGQAEDGKAGPDQSGGEVQS